jgi:hypothetical protein
MVTLELQVCQVPRGSEGHQEGRDGMGSLEVLDHLDHRVLRENSLDMMQQHWRPSWAKDRPRYKQNKLATGIDTLHRQETL